MTTVRTRFAPSPTGYLHLGGARTALYAWLYARHHNGIFVLRIEDTDLERSTQAAIGAILESMDWLGLHPDEGPFYQTHRFGRYLDVARQLLAQQKAYKCYCSKERLLELRDKQTALKEKPRYDGLCRSGAVHPENAPYVIRFANPLEGEVIFDDAVHDRTVFKNTELDDLIIVRSDGSPTYNFCVVVDDWEMKITHVIRGDDHLNNTPRQINILKALEADLPVYAHIPMILGSDGKRFSKRHGAVSVMQYREEGFLPHALLNYLVRLGWSHGDQEIFSKKEMIELFDIHDVNKSAAAFNPEKLLWINQQYLKTDKLEDIEGEFLWQLKKHTAENEIKNEPDIKSVISIQRERCKTLKEMAQRSRFFYENILPAAELQQKHINDEIKPALKLLYQQLEALEDWTDESLHQCLNETAEKSGIKLGELAQPMRVILSGGTVSPPLNSTLRVIGKTKTLEKMTQFTV